MMMRHYGLQHEHYYYEEPKKSVQFAKIVRKGSDWFALHENVYDALILTSLFSSYGALTSPRRFQSSASAASSLCCFSPALRDSHFALDFFKTAALQCSRTSAQTHRTYDSILQPERRIRRFPCAAEQTRGASDGVGLGDERIDGVSSRALSLLCAQWLA